MTLLLMLLTALIALAVISSIEVFHTTPYESDTGLQKTIVVGGWFYGVLMISGGICIAIAQRMDRAIAAEKSKGRRY